MHLHYIRRGAGVPLLLIPGLGSTWRTWQPILDQLALERYVIAIDLPGFGQSPGIEASPSIPSYADAIEQFLSANDLLGVDVVGCSFGASLALELSMRGVTGACVALSPCGFWKPRKSQLFQRSIETYSRLIHRFEHVLPKLASWSFGRTLLFSILSSNPERIPIQQALSELMHLATSNPFNPLLKDEIATNDTQVSSREPAQSPILVGWGRLDRLCSPKEAEAVLAKYPTARIHWFEFSGHFPHWDSPEETGRVILRHARASWCTPNLSVFQAEKISFETKTGSVLSTY